MTKRFHWRLQSKSNTTVVLRTGGGTTDYAVEIFHAALGDGHYKCFLHQDAKLPFLYMPDCLAATYQLMTAPAASLTQVGMPS